MKLVGAVDIDPAKAGRPLSEFVPDAPARAMVHDDPRPMLKRKAPDIALVTTGSRVREVEPLIHALARRGVAVVASCEELLYPWYADDALARSLDKTARKGGVAVLGAGVNPGFVLDAFAAVCTTPMESVRAIKAVRIVDAATRREPLQRKVGAGMSPAEFRALADENRIGHVGLVESVLLLADAMGWALDEVTENLAPKIATGAHRTKYLSVAKGQVAGILHEAKGRIDGRTVITLRLEMYVGAESPSDTITVTGKPGLRVVIEGGTPGDLATAAIMVNLIPRVLEAAPGLCTMAEIALPRYTLGR